MTHLSVIKRRALWVIAWLVAGCLPRAAVAFAADPYVSFAPPIPETPVDKPVVLRWRQLGITPAGTCSDAVFIRRVYLDVIGTLPSALEARDFILDRSPDKRRRLINRVLDRDEFADFWAMKWGDLLRVKAEFPINLWPNAARAYHHWIHSCLQDNMPYNRFVREMLTASGSNFRVGSVNFYRAMQNREPAGIAQAVALTFMGARASQWPSHQLLRRNPRLA